MRLTERAHLVLSEFVQEGDLAIDATAGNGHDTLKLTQLVSPNGHVYAIDLQEEAINTTWNRLEAQNALRNCTLIHGDHSQALQDLVVEQQSQVTAIIFNLGYLPGADKRIHTKPDTTLQALETSAGLLKSGGLLCVTAYRGHGGGIEEANVVADWIQKKTVNGWQTQSYEPDKPTKEIPPILWTTVKA
ncbi:MAG: class I SAM-dependent methyltransferase [Verrucomicrobiota bacterium]